MPKSRARSNRPNTPKRIRRFILDWASNGRTFAHPKFLATSKASSKVAPPCSLKEVERVVLNALLNIVRLRRQILTSSSEKPIHHEIVDLTSSRALDRSQ